MTLNIMLNYTRINANMSQLFDTLALMATGLLQVPFRTTQ